MSTPENITILIMAWIVHNRGHRLKRPSSCHEREEFVKGGQYEVGCNTDYWQNLKISPYIG